MNQQQSREITITRRFRGPPRSGNGGYVGGLLAGALGGVAEVTLRAPPPLDTPLRLEVSDSGARLLRDGAAIALAKPGELSIAPPPPISLVEALAASARYPDPATHIYPECFVCGPHRAHGDGLCIFAGPTEDKRMAAAVWTPVAQDADSDGRVKTEIAWAALDCPSYFGLMRPGLPVLLGRMTAKVIAPPRAETPHVVMGWKTGQDWRKHFAGSAIYSEQGRLLGLSQTTWIELTPADAARHV